MEQSEEQVKKIICQSDLEAFCCNKSLCKEVVAHRNGYRTFNKPILFVGSCWFAYRNMFFTTIVCLLQLYLWKTGGTAV